MKKVKKRLLKIVNLLYTQSDTVITGKEMSELLGTTTRTIRSDIKSLNTILEPYEASIESMRGIGYKLVIKNDRN